ncbi:MAG: HDIG domain-containing protein [Nanohaloarchaea archaeon]|nr:HDIG domain-containing protein [Candidatus Nanohaloarchaea archaeon]
MDKTITEDEAIELLEKQFEKFRPDWKDEILKHSIIVRDLSLFLADRIKEKIDIDFLKSACILHDIGYATAKEKIRHGVVGADFLRLQGLGRYAKCCARHIGIGITKDEALKLGLSDKELIPKTIEEKILCYCDNLDFFDKETKMHTIKSSDAVAEKFGKELGPEYKIKTEKFNRMIEDKVGKDGMCAFLRSIDKYNQKLRIGSELNP